MTSSSSPTIVLDRPGRSQPVATEDGGRDPRHHVAPGRRPARADDAVLPDAVVSRPAGRPPPPPPPGWGSHEDRRLARWLVAVFFLLGVYAAVFVTIAQLVWT
jgi:hypothetical protein